MGAALSHTASRQDRVQGGEAGEFVPLVTLRDGESTLGVLEALSAEVARAPEVAHALNGVLDGLLRLTHADTGAIHLISGNPGDLDLVASRGLSQRFQQMECRIPHGVCLCGRAVDGDEPVVVNDLASDCSLERRACVEEMFGSLVAVPCRSRGRTFGLLTLYAGRQGAFEQIDRVLLRNIGSHLGAAIDNAQWVAVARERAVADERQVIAGELHDGVAQSLAYLNLQVTRVQELLARGATDGVGRELAAVREGIQSAYNDIRQLLADFRLAPSDSTTFDATLRKQAEAFSTRTGTPVHVSGEGHAAALSFGQRAEVFRIIQEALANVRKHAGASNIWIACEHRDGRFLLRVTDDGVGFDPARVDGSSGLHVGTSMIRERAARLRGHVTIDSQPGRGATVSVSVPCPLAEERTLS
jgi:two-component system nitrate/nitrite sensor histidine kinase NarX